MSDELSLDLFEEPDALPDPPPPPAEPPPKVWSVSQVNRAVRGLLEDNVEPLWVGGEIGSWTRSRAGHCYFTLKDERAQIRAVMFSREAQALPIDPEDGADVRVFGDLTLYEARGEYQLVGRRLEAQGADGLWRIAFEKLRAKLEAEGLLAPARKKPLPPYPACIGVVTSPSGAALRDIISVLRRRAPWTRLVLSGSKVQGEGAALEIADAIRRLDEAGVADVIIVSRGGGSVEDLWAFNEEPVARAVADCVTPVVSAVGHEVDVTISDLVADLRAPTPSAGAEAVVPDRSVLQAQLRRAPERLGSGLRRSMERRRHRVSSSLHRLTRAITLRSAPARQAVDRDATRLETRMKALAAARAARLATLSGRLQALSPLSTLARGYAVAHSEGGDVLRRVADFEGVDVFRLRVTDGSVTARRLETTSEGSP